MSKDVFERISELDDLKVVNLFRQLGPMLFKDPEIRSLLVFERTAGSLAALTNIPLTRKQELLDSHRSIWLARVLLTAFAAQPRFSHILSKALDSLPRDELLLEATVPLGLATDSLRLLASARETEKVGRAYQRSEMGVVYQSSKTGDQAPDILVKIAQFALATGSPPPPAASIVWKQAASETKSAPPNWPSLREVYPDIAADDVHPVVNATVHFSVSLAAHPTETTQGVVKLPEAPPEFEHKLLVHLLFGTASAWDTLTWSAQRGTIKAATFSLPAPSIQGVRALVDARANFYLNRRWCGEGQRNLDVRSDAAIVPLAEIPPPKLPPWPRDLVLQPDAQPPDLVVRIQKGTVSGDFVWSCLSPHMEFPPPAQEVDGRMSLKEDAATFVRRTFAPLANMPLERLKLADVEGAGEKLYRSTPTYFRDCYWALWHAAEAGGFAFDSVQIVTDEPCVPWELMRMIDLTDASAPAPELLAIRHCVGRWLAAETGSMRQRIGVSKVAVSASSYEGITMVSAKLPWAASEHKLMVDTYHADDVPLTSDGLLDFLEGGAAQALHLACHGKMSITDPDSSVLVMEDTPRDLTPLSVARSEVRQGLGSQHPLVFLNACEVGAAGASLSLVAGFPAAFLYAGASALVSPLWAVNDERAGKIAAEFYREAFVAGGGKPLGAVLRDLRARWRQEKHLTYLAYVLYGDPMVRVDYQ